MSRRDGPRWSDYERRIRAGLANLRIVVREMDDAGGEYHPKSRTAYWDPFNASGIDFLVHELLHHCMYHKLAGWGEGEEPITETLEAEIVRYINRSRERRRWWRRALKAKLGEGA